MTTPDGVPLLDFRRISEEEKAEFREAFAQVLDSGAFILGPEVQAFERECAETIGVRHALGVSSGTDALLLAMMALGIGAGDEVIVPTYTFFATAGTVWRLGAKPVFVDIHPCSYNLRADDVAAKITDRTRAIIPVHLYGQCCDMSAIRAVAEEHDLPIIEDAAQGIGAAWDIGKGGPSPAGSLGTIGCISFYPTKNLSGFGDSGLVTTDDDDLHARMESLRIHGHGPKYYHSRVGGNFRMDAIQGALLRKRLVRLPEVTKKRGEHAAFYCDALTESGVAVLCRAAGAVGEEERLVLPAACAPVHTYNQFIVRVPERIGRDAMRAGLAERGVSTEVYYPLCLHEQECFRELGYSKGDFPVAEGAAASTLALPIYPDLREDERQRVVDAVVELAS